jgi:hypothetical protein
MTALVVFVYVILMGVELGLPKKGAGVTAIGSRYWSVRIRDVAMHVCMCVHAGVSAVHCLNCKSQCTTSKTKMLTLR